MAAYGVSSTTRPPRHSIVSVPIYTDGQSGLPKTLLATDRLWRILLKVECWRSQPQQGSAEPIRASVVVFALIDVVPDIATREERERP